jgi:hypothetical protein
MKIEVLTKPDATSKEKGDLLEELARDLLRAQSFSVKTQVRVYTGCENPEYSVFPASWSPDRLIGSVNPSHDGGLARRHFLPI